MRVVRVVGVGLCVCTCARMRACACACVCVRVCGVHVHVLAWVRACILEVSLSFVFSLLVCFVLCTSL